MQPSDRLRNEIGDRLRIEVGRDQWGTMFPDDWGTTQDWLNLISFLFGNGEPELGRLARNEFRDSGGDWTGAIS